MHLCYLQLCFSIDRIRSIYGHKQISMTSYVMEITKYLVYFHVALDRLTKERVTNRSNNQFKSPSDYMLR